MPAHDVSDDAFDLTGRVALVTGQTIAVDGGPNLGGIPD